MSEIIPEEKKKIEEDHADSVIAASEKLAEDLKQEEKLHITTLAIAYFPGFNDNPKLVVGLQTKEGIVTINDFRGADAKGLFTTLTNPKIQKVIKLEGRKKK